MTPYAKQSLEWLDQHWHHFIVKGPDAAKIIGVNQNTLKTRIKSGKVMLERSSDPNRVRDTLEYTGYHLAYNMIFDQMSRYGLVSGKDDEVTETVTAHAEFVKDHVLSGEMNTDLVFKFYGPEGVGLFDIHDDAIQAIKDFNKTVVLIPIGRMMLELAARSWALNEPSAVQSFMLCEQ